MILNYSLFTRMFIKAKLKKKVRLPLPGFNFHTRIGRLFQGVLVEKTIGKRESEWHRIKKHSGNIFLLHVLNGNKIILNNVLLYCSGGDLSGKLFSKAYKNYLRRYARAVPYQN